MDSFGASPADSNNLKILCSHAPVGCGRGEVHLKFLAGLCAGVSCVK